MRAKEYISAAYELIRNGADITVVLSHLNASLAKRGLQALHTRILRGLIEKIRRGERTLIPKVIIAREDDLKRLKHAIETALSSLGEKEHETVIDPSIIGGFIAIGKGKRFDQSHKNTLLHVYHKLAD